MRRSHVLLLSFLALPACGRPAGTNPVVDAGATAAPALAAQPAVEEADASASPAPSADDSHVASVSVAAYAKGDVLDECDDITVVIRGIDAGADFDEKLAKGATDPKTSGRKADEVLRLSKRCTEQFRDKTWLASCTVRHTESVRDDAGAERGSYDVSGNTYYYDLASLQDDHWSKDCIKAGGDWSGVDKDSRAYSEAKLAMDTRKLEELRKKLGR